MENFEEEYCRACRLALNGPGYFCERCSSMFHGCYLHENCAKLPKEIQHPLHSHHHLNLYARSPYMVNYIICDECAEFCFGFFYLCEECDFKLDLNCATRAPLRSYGSNSILRDSDREIELFHFSHRHKLVFGNYRDPTYKRNCNFCRLQIFGPTYNCIHCGWILHEPCLRLPQEMQIPIHPQHISILSYMRYGVCYACLLKLVSGGYCYGCQECGLNFHITCATSLGRALKWKSHEHDLYYFGVDFQRFFAMYTDFVDIFAALYCSQCIQICSGNPFYRCLDCGINFHLECVSIPRIVRSKEHMVHPLTLKDSFLGDDSEDNYCDICEEKRKSSDHVYFCEQCDGLFVAHIECTLAEEQEVLSYLNPRERKRRTRRPHWAWSS